MDFFAFSNHRGSTVNILDGWLNVFNYKQNNVNFHTLRFQDLANDFLKELIILIK